MPDTFRPNQVNFLQCTSCRRPALAMIIFWATYRTPARWWGLEAVINSSQAKAWSFFTIFRQFFPAGSLRVDPSDCFALLLPSFRQFQPGFFSLLSR